ncbi:hypothetical protein BJ170DRAFT_686208 [Xylariales sp. AK1849]|nr:hypothetical protein BJ170DRAFT_686208 [Xylariales sp. AK1849]
MPAVTESLIEACRIAITIECRFSDLSQKWIYTCLKSYLRQISYTNLSGRLSSITHFLPSLSKRSRPRRAVVLEYVFARTPVADEILARMYEGTYHPISSIFFSGLIRQKDRISLADRLCVVEWKARLDLARYAVLGCAPLDEHAIPSYSNPASDSIGWDDLYQAVRQEHEACFPVGGDMRLKLARMCQDTTTNMDVDLKWVFFTGFEQPWQQRPDLQAKKKANISFN